MLWRATHHHRKLCSISVQQLPRVCRERFLPNGYWRARHVLTRTFLHTANLALFAGCSYAYLSNKLEQHMSRALTEADNNSKKEKHEREEKKPEKQTEPGGAVAGAASSHAEQIAAMEFLQRVTMLSGTSSLSLLSSAQPACGVAWLCFFWYRPVRASPCETFYLGPLSVSLCVHLPSFCCRIALATCHQA